MARKTKAEAEATRSSILDAAERVFQQQGVSRSTLQDIAAAAGVTRGAVYWHFQDKGAVFNAMLERVLLSLEDAATLHRPLPGEPPLAALERHVVATFERAVADEQAQRVFDIVTHKAEYVGEMGTMRQRLLRARRLHLAMLTDALAQAGLPADEVPLQAQCLQALIDGVFKGWMLDPTAFDPLRVARQSVRNFIQAVQARLACTAPPPGGGFTSAA